MRKRTRPVWNNCLLAICYLIIRGQVKSVVAVSSLSPWFPWHFIGVTGRGHAIHFQTLGDRDELAPFWFDGCFVGVSSLRQEEVLAASGRRLHFVVPMRIFLMTTLCFLSLVLPLWLLAFAAFP